jgi:hypothetical protein
VSSFTRNNGRRHDDAKILHFLTSSPHHTTKKDIKPKESRKVAPFVGGHEIFFTTSVMVKCLLLLVGFIFHVVKTSFFSFSPTENSPSVRQALEDPIMKLFPQVFV